MEDLTKKEMIEILVSETDHTKSELKSILKEEVKEIFDKYFTVEGVEEVDEEEDVIEVVEDQAVLSEEDESSETDDQSLSKAEKRRLMRLGKI